MFGWATLPILDSFHALSSILASPRGRLGVFNPGGYRNPKVDELVDKIAVEMDEPRRLKMISEAFKLAQEDCVIIPLHQQPLSWPFEIQVKISRLQTISPVCGMRDRLIFKPIQEGTDETNSFCSR